MFKKMVILAVAALMVLSPMAALAVEWDTVQSALQSGASFNEDGIAASKDAGGAVTVTGNGGTITNLNITEPGSYTFGGTIAFNGSQPTFRANSGTLQVTVKEGAAITYSDPQSSIVVKGSGAAKVTFTNNGTIEVGVSVETNPPVTTTATVTNNGTIMGNMNVYTFTAGKTVVTNKENATIGGKLVIDVYDEAADMKVFNDGTVTGNIVCTVYAGSLSLNNTGSAANMKLLGLDKIEAVNSGTVSGQLVAGVDKNGDSYITNNGTVGEVLFWMQNGANITFDNQGKVTNEITVQDTTGNDLSGTVTFVVQTQSSGVVDTETLQEVIRNMNVDLSGANRTKVYIVTTDANGKKTARYALNQDDGTLMLLKVYMDTGALPKTGDTSAMALWLALLTLSGVSLLILRRKTAS